MSSTVKFKALLGLAKADGVFDQLEKDFISSLAIKQGLSARDLRNELGKKEKLSVLASKLDFDDKIEILMCLIRLMKVDGKVVLSEINYCERVARVLGFQEKSIGFLSSALEFNPHADVYSGRISYRMRKYMA